MPVRSQGHRNIIFVKRFEQVLDSAIRNYNSCHHTEMKFLTPATQTRIAEDFLKIMFAFKKRVEDDPTSHLSQEDANPAIYPKHEEMQRVVWSESQSVLQEELKKELQKCFREIGSPMPGRASALWSGPGAKSAASSQGLELTTFVAGALLDEMDVAIKSTIVPMAYEKNGKADTTTYMGIWNAMSKLYAENTHGDAHVFLLHGVVDDTSVFWNTELPELRKKQDEGSVTRIMIHSLTPQARAAYLELSRLRDGLEFNVEKHREKQQNFTKLATINQAMIDITTKKDNWTVTDIDAPNSGLELKNRSRALHIGDARKTIRPIKEQVSEVVRLREDPMYFQEKYTDHLTAITYALESTTKPVRTLLETLAQLRGNVMKDLRSARLGGDVVNKDLILRLEEEKKKISATIDECTTILQKQLPELVELLDPQTLSNRFSRPLEQLKLRLDEANPREIILEAKKLIQEARYILVKANKSEHSVLQNDTTQTALRGLVSIVTEAKELIEAVKQRQTSTPSPISLGSR